MYRSRLQIQTDESCDVLNDLPAPPATPSVGISAPFLDPASSDTPAATAAAPTPAPALP